MFLLYRTAGLTLRDKVIQKDLRVKKVVAISGETLGPGQGVHLEIPQEQQGEARWEEDICTARQG